MEVVRGDFGDPESLDAALDGVHAVFSMSAQPIFAEPAPTHDMALAEACRRAHVRRIVKLSVLGGGGHDPESPIVRWVRAAESTVTASGAEWTLLRPGRFMSNTEYRESRPRGRARAILENRLVGGLYGVQSGAPFAAESMFHRVTDASKIAVVAASRSLHRAGIQVFDVQFATSHLRSLGVKEISRDDYLARVARASVFHCRSVLGRVKACAGFAAACGSL